MMQRHITKKKFYRFVVAGVVICSILGGIVAHFYWLDGISGVFWEILIGETVYSKDYHEHKFRQIRVGMTEEQVLTLIGEPLFQGPYFLSVWFYSYGKPVNLDGEEPWITDSCYTERILHFHEGKVYEIHHDFYFD